MAMIYDPNRDCYVDTVTLEPRQRHDGEPIRREWLGNRDLAGFCITPQSLRAKGG